MKMVLIIILFILASLIVSVIFIFPLFLGSFLKMKEKTMSTEAGFKSVGSIYKSFSVQFFYLMVIFIIFDLEVLFLFGLVSQSISFWGLAWFWVFIMSTLWLEWWWNKFLWWT